MSSTPALFIGHGSPMNTLERNGSPSVGACTVIGCRSHVLFFDFDYPALGAPDIAAEIVEAIKPAWCGLDRDQWGIDHGAWSVLAQLYPKADVPVLQLSINALKPLTYHLELGGRLASLRENGIMVLASGNVVHNLGRIQWSRPEAAFDWAKRFDDAVARQLAESPADILKLVEHPDYCAAVPTPDHFIPLLYVAGMAQQQGLPLHVLLRGYAMGSLSMTCFGQMSVSPTERRSALRRLPADLHPAHRSNLYDHV